MDRLIKFINIKTFCDLIDNAYINNYKRLFLNKLSAIPEPNDLNEACINLDKILKNMIKRKVFQELKNKLKVNNFVERIKNTLLKKLKEKFMSKFVSADTENKNMDKKKLNILKGAKKLDKVISNNLKTYAFNKMKDNYQLFKNIIEKLKKAKEKTFKKIFMQRLKEKADQVTGLKNIQKVLDKKKCREALNKLHEIVNSPEDDDNKLRANCKNLKKILAKIILEKAKKPAYNEIKKNYNLNEASNRLNRLMNNRYKKRLLNLIRLINNNNKPKESKIESRYPLLNMADLSSNIEKLLMKKIKNKFINELKNIQNIDKQLNYMFLALKNKINKETFDTLKAIDFVDHLNKAINNNMLLKKRKFFNALKDALKEDEEKYNDLLQKCLEHWNDLSNKNKILDLLKNRLNKKKKKKYFDFWKKKADLNKIKKALIKKKRKRDRENKRKLRKYLYKWKNNSKKIKKKIKDKQQREKERKEREKKEKERKKKLLLLIKKLKNKIKLLKYFNKWKELADKKNILENLIKKKKYEKALKKKYFNKWKELADKKNILENLIKNIKDKKALEKSFNKWKENADKMNILENMIKKLKDKQALEKSFNKWKEFADKKNILEKLIKGLKDKKALEKTLNKWKEYTDKMNILENLIKKLKDKNELEKTFNKWKEYTDKKNIFSNLTKKLNDKKTLRKYFNKWKNYVYKKNKRIKDKENKERRKKLSNVIKKLKDKILLQHQLKKWKEYADKKNILSKLLKKRKKDKKALAKKFKKWKEYADKKNILSKLLKLLKKRKNDKTTLKKNFKKWKEYAGKKNIRENMINKLKDKKELRDHFNKWKNYADKKNILSKLLKLLKKRNNDKKAIKKYFNKLKEYSDKKNILSNLLKRKKDKIALGKYFNKWKQYIQKIKKKLKDKQNKDRKRRLSNLKRKIKDKILLDKYLNKWKDYLNKKKLLSNLKKWKKKKIKLRNNFLLRKNLRKLKDKAIRRKALNKFRKLSKLNKIFNMLNNKEKELINKVFNILKNYSKKDKPKKKVIIIPEKIYDTEFLSEKPKIPELSVIKDNDMSFPTDKNKTLRQKKSHLKDTFYPNEIGKKRLNRSKSAPKKPKQPNLSIIRDKTMSFISDKKKNKPNNNYYSNGKRDNRKTRSKTAPKRPKKPLLSIVKDNTMSFISNKKNKDNNNLNNNKYIPKEIGKKRNNRSKSAPRKPKEPEIPKIKDNNNIDKKNKPNNKIIKNKKGLNDVNKPNERESRPNRWQSTAKRAEKPEIPNKNDKNDKNSKDNKSLRRNNRYLYDFNNPNEEKEERQNRWLSTAKRPEKPEIIKNKNDKENKDNKSLNKKNKDLNDNKNPNEKTDKRKTRSKTAPKKPKKPELSFFKTFINNTKKKDNNNFKKNKTDLNKIGPNKKRLIRAKTAPKKFKKPELKIIKDNNMKFISNKKNKKEIRPKSAPKKPKKPELSIIKDNNMQFISNKKNKDKDKDKFKPKSISKRTKKPELTIITDNYMSLMRDRDKNNKPNNNLKKIKNNLNDINSLKGKNEKKNNFTFSPKKPKNKELSIIKEQDIAFISDKKKKDKDNNNLRRNKSDFPREPKDKKKLNMKSQYKKPEKIEKPDLSIIKEQDLAFISDNKIKIKDDNIRRNKSVLNVIYSSGGKRDSSFKRRRVRKMRSKSKPKSRASSKRKNKNNGKLQKYFDKWNKKAKEMKLKEDFNHIINGIKKYNIPQSNDNDFSDLLQKLKNATAYLLYYIYRNNSELLLKKYLNKWLKNIKKKNNNKNFENINYIKRAIDGKQLLPNQNNKNLRRFKVWNDKIFSKRKTKPNLYQETIDIINSLSRNKMRRDKDYNRSATEANYNNYSIPSNQKRNKNKNKTYMRPDYTMNNIIDEFPDKEYISKSMEKRKPKKKLIDIISSNDNEDKNLEFPEFLDNKINGEKKYDTELNNINANLEKSLSSINNLSPNHFDLIEEGNEVRKAINKNKDKENIKKIRYLLSVTHDNGNNNLNRSTILTDRKSNYNNPNSSNYDNDSYIFRSRSQKYRKKNKYNTFTLSIPTNRREDEVGLEYINKNNNYNNLIKNIKNSEIKGNKKTPESSYNNIYSDANSNNKSFKYTPFKDYSVNWEEGNPTCPQIIKNHSMPDYNLIELNPLEDQRKTKTYRRHLKKNSAPDNIPGKNGFYSNNNKSSNYIDTEYNLKRKNLFV